MTKRLAPQGPAGSGDESARRNEGAADNCYSFGECGPDDFGPRKNVLSRDVEVKGSIKFDEELIFDGRLDGEVLSEGTLILGENSDVQGEIRTRSVSLSGRVQGNITVRDKCELKGRAQLRGDLKAARLVIEEGATFVGRSEVTPHAAAAQAGDAGGSNPNPETTAPAG